MFNFSCLRCSLSMAHPTPYCNPLFFYLEMIFLWLLKRNSQESKHHECFIIHSAIDQRKTVLDCKNCEGPNLWQAELVMALTTERFIFPDFQKISQSLPKN